MFKLQLHSDECNQLFLSKTCVFLYSLKLLVSVSNKQICLCLGFFHEAQMYSNDFGYEVDIFNCE